MPTRFIHSRSSLMPSLAMLPFIQCHQTRGLALSGGSRNPRSSGSAFCAETDHAMNRAAASEAQPIVRCMIDYYIARPRTNGDGPGLFPARQVEMGEGTVPAGNVSGGRNRVRHWDHSLTVAARYRRIAFPSRAREQAGSISTKDGEVSGKSRPAPRLHDG